MIYLQFIHLQFIYLQFIHLQFTISKTSTFTSTTN